MKIPEDDYNLLNNATWTLCNLKMQMKGCFYKKMAFLKTLWTFCILINLACYEMQSITLLILKKAMHSQHIFWGAKLISQRKKWPCAQINHHRFSPCDQITHKMGGGDTKNLVLCLLQAATSLPQNLKAKLDKSVKMRNVNPMRVSKCRI